MRLPKEFEYYLKKKIIRKISPDLSRAKFLLKESEISLEGLKERIKIIGINNKNSNSIIRDCYNIIMEKIRARLLLKGYSSSGNYSHEAELSYLREISFSDNEISFLNNLRYFRNSSIYYGKLLDKEYAKRVFDFLIKIKKRLK
jgi:hypothetical protein